MPDWREDIEARLRGSRLDPAVEADVVEELSQHMDDRYAELRSRGVSDHEARERALAELEAEDFALSVARSRAGSWPPPEPVQDASILAGMVADVRYAIHTLRRAPGYAAVVMLTLALGIGAAVAAQAVIDPLLLRPLGFHRPDRLVTLDTGMLPGEFVVIRDNTTVFSATALTQPGRSWGIAGEGEAERVIGAVVTPDFFATLGVTPHAGAAPTDVEEDLAVLSHDFWRRRFGGDAGIIGNAVQVDGRPVVVTAVMPPGFDYPSRTHVWLMRPLNTADVASVWGMGGARMIARLHDDATPASAEAAIRPLSGAMSAANPFWTPAPDYRADVGVISLHEALVGDVRRALLMLGAAVALLLLIACANVANLVLARGLRRARELAVRTALGASSGRIVRQLLTETMVISAAGGLAGICLAYGAVHVLRGMLPTDLPRLSEVGVDARVLVASLAVTMATGLLLGVLPAMRARRFDLQTALRAGGRSLGDRSGRRLSGGLVVMQVALAVLLVSGAGLLVRSLAALQQTDTGIARMEVVTARIDLPSASYGRAADRGLFFDELMTRVTALPGVQSAAATSQLPFSGELALNAMLVEHVTPDPNDLPVFIYRRVTPQLFHALGVPLLQGRLLTEADGAPGALPVAVVDATTAREFWPDQDPIGRRLGRPWLNELRTVVGVVGAVLDGELAGAAEPTVYAPLAAEPPNSAYLLIASAAGPGIIPALRNTLRDLDPAVPLSDVGTLNSMISGTLSAQRLATTLLASFGILALILAAIGIYGVLAYEVNQRRAELSLRLALGARASDLLRLVFLDGMRLAVLGASIGIVTALLLGRFLRGMLFGVTPNDPLTLAVVVVTVIAAAALAVLVPALRASGIAPMQSLRD